MNPIVQFTPLEGRTLRTLDRRNAFHVVSVTDDIVSIRVQSTNKPRPIPMREIEHAYPELVAAGHITRVDIEARHSPRNPAYVAAMIAEFPGVRWQARPIRLVYALPG